MSQLSESESFALGLHSLRQATISMVSESAANVLKYYEDYSDQMLTTLALPPNTRLRFVISDDARIMGRAIRETVDGLDYRFAVVSAGALLYFHQFFPYLLSRVDVMRDLGIVARERNLSHQFKPDNSHPATSWLLSRNLISHIIPIDPVRREFSSMMSAAACKFLIMHEFGHCLNGHLGHEHHSLDEADGPVKIGSTATLHRHTLEMDADSYATGGLFQMPYLYHPEETNHVWSRSIGYPSHRSLYPSLMAVWIVFRILSDPQRLPMSQEGLLANTHPHAAVRAHLCRGHIVRIASERGGIEPDGWISVALAKSAFDALKVWECVSGEREPERLLYMDDYSAGKGFERVGAYTETLLDHYATIKATLEKSAFVPLSNTRDEDKAQGLECKVKPARQVAHSSDPKIWVPH